MRKIRHEIYGVGKVLDSHGYFLRVLFEKQLPDIVRGNNGGTNILTVGKAACEDV